MTDEFADRALVRGIRKMDGDVPSPKRAFESSDRSLAFGKALAQKIGKASCRLLVGDGEGGAMGAGGKGHAARWLGRGAFSYFQAGQSLRPGSDLSPQSAPQFPRASPRPSRPQQVCLAQWVVNCRKCHVPQ